MEKYERAINKLDVAYRKGAIDLHTYNRLMREQDNVLAKANRNTSAMVGNVKRLVLAYLSFRTVSTVLRNLLEVMQEIDEFAKRARGIEENYNQLRRFSFAAQELAGVSGPAAVELLSKLTKKVGEAKLGMGESVKAFEMLGLELKELEGLSPVEMFNRVAKAIRETEDPTKRTAIAVKLFESEGKKLLPLLTATAEAFGEAASQADRFGLTLREDQIKNIEAFNDQVNRAKEGVTGWYTELAKNTTALLAMDEINEAIVTVRKGIELTLDSMRNFRNPFAGPMSGPGAQSFADWGAGPLMGAPSVQGGAPAPIPFADKEVSGGGLLGSGIDSLADKIRSGAGGLMDIVGSVQEAATTIALSGMHNTQELIKATTEDPAIAAMEVGTQEAYAFLTQATTDAAAEAAKSEENKKRLEENANSWREKQVQWLERIYEAFDGGGMSKLPGRG